MNRDVQDEERDVVRQVDTELAPVPGPETRSPINISWSSWGRAVVVILVSLAFLWALSQARHLVALLVVSLFFGAALVPGVNRLHERHGWRRGAAVWAIYGVGLVTLAFMTLVLIPAIGGLADEIGRQGPTWLATLDGWASRTLGVHIASASAAQGAAATTQQFLIDWSGKLTGAASNAVTGGVSLVVSVATIATFTFYFAADFPRLERGLLSWFPPAHQQRLGWAIDESIDQVGTYLYSRHLLTAINAIGFFITMVAVGVPARFAMPLAIFGGFVSEFIPTIGTYIGGAIPTIFTLAIKDLTAAIVVLAYVVIYQQLENYWLSPKISAKTMELNGGLAFGAALAGGALFGPMGAFMAIPVAALIYSLIRNYRHGYTVSYESRYASTAASPDTERQDASEHAEAPSPTEGRS